MTLTIWKVDSKADILLADEQAESPVITVDSWLLWCAKKKVELRAEEKAIASPINKFQDRHVFSTHMYTHTSFGRAFRERRMMDNYLTSRVL